MLPLKNVTGLEYKPLIRSKAWRERRRALMRKYGKVARDEVQAYCHSARAAPCKQKKDKGDLEDGKRKEKLDQKKRS